MTRNERKERIDNFTLEKMNGKRKADRLVSDELLNMGFCYGYIGTHYLHDVIVWEIQHKLEDFEGARDFYLRGVKSVMEKYSIGDYQCKNDITESIERAFAFGDINYLLEVFKGSYDYDKMKVASRVFTMTVRNKILMGVEEEQSYDERKLKRIIHKSIDDIADMAVLYGIKNIMEKLTTGTATLPI